MRLVIDNPSPGKRLKGKFANFLEDPLKPRREGPQRVRSVMTIPPGCSKHADDGAKRSR